MKAKFRYSTALIPFLLVQASALATPVRAGTDDSDADPVADSASSAPAAPDSAGPSGAELLALSLASQPAASSDQQAMDRILRDDPAIPRAALEKAFHWLRGRPEEFPNRNVMTIIDFDQSSKTKRMHVIDLNKQESVRYLVAHGKNSGFDIPTQFSNRNNSDQSSLGVYATDQPYTGEHGLSLKLRGLESTNDLAFKRKIVLHGADYVSEKIANSKKRLGRSNGCPAVEPRYAPSLVRQLEGGSLLLIHSSVSSR